MDLANCPVRVAADVIAGKWKPLILFAMKAGAQRYGALRRAVAEPSEKVFIQQLRQLERDGVIERSVRPGRVPEVSYSLTPHGRNLAPILELMAVWGKQHRRKGLAATDGADGAGLGAYK
jgi:DNA-binding HxlR family transcriptional regulator